MPTPLADVRTIARYVITHIDAGRDASDPKLRKDLTTLGTNIDKVLDALGPPATLEQRIAYLVRNTPTKKDLENLVSELSDLVKNTATATGAAAEAASVKVIDLINANVTTENEQRAVIAELQGKAEADATLIAELRAQIEAGALDEATVREAIASLEATNTRLGDLDSNPLTPV